MSDDLRPDPAFDSAARAWMSVGPSIAPRRVVAAAITEIATVERRSSRVRRLRPGWRLQLRSAAFAGLAAVLLVGVVLLPRLGGSIGPGGLPSSATVPPALRTLEPTLEPTPVPTNVDTTGWQSFSSGLYGYSMRFPADWESVKGQTAWTLERFSNRFLPEWGDDIAFGSASGSGNPFFHAWSIPRDAGVDLADYIGALIHAGGVAYAQCPQAPDAWQAVTIDGNPGWLVGSTCNGQWAFAAVEAGGRFYTFWVDDRVDWPDSPRFRTILSTVHLRPQDADTSPSGSPVSTP